MIDHVKTIRMRKKYSMYEILPLTGVDLVKFKEYYPESLHVNVIVCYYDRKVVVVPCGPGGTSDWDGGGLFEADWSDADYEKTVQEIKEGGLISW